MDATRKGIIVSIFAIVFLGIFLVLGALWANVFLNMPGASSAGSNSLPSLFLVSGSGERELSRNVLPSE